METTITHFTGSAGYANFAYWTWDEMIRTVLRGSVEITETGNDVVFEDRYSENRVEVSSSGGTVDAIRLFLSDDAKAPQATELAVLIALDEDKPSRDEIVDGFTAFFEQSGRGEFGAALRPLAPLFGRSTEFVTEGSTPVDSPADIGARIRGLDDDDVFRLNDGSHTIVASPGNDLINGGGGYDDVQYNEGFFPGLKLSKAGAAVEIDKGEGFGVDTLRNIESLYGSNRADNLSKGLSNADTTIFGGGGNDKVGGRAGDDALSGDDGNDVLIGRAGNDVLVGGDGRDILKGGGGNDVLVGGGGFGGERFADVLAGQKGKDLFVLEAPLPSFFDDGKPDPVIVIKDFRDGEDFIGLAGSEQAVFDFDDGELVFDDLIFTKQNEDTVISVVEVDFGGNETETPLAILKNVAPGQIDRADFVEAVDVFELLYANEDPFFF